MAYFLYEYVFTRYSLPREIVISDKGTHCINEVVQYLLDDFVLVHKKLSPYHPQENDQVESTRKILCTVLTKIVRNSKTDWKLKLNLAPTLKKKEENEATSRH